MIRVMDRNGIFCDIKDTNINIDIQKIEDNRVVGFVSLILENGTVINDPNNLNREGLIDTFHNYSKPEYISKFMELINEGVLDIEKIKQETINKTQTLIRNKKILEVIEGDLTADSLLMSYTKALTFLIGQLLKGIEFQSKQQKSKEMLKKAYRDVIDADGNTEIIFYKVLYEDGTEHDISFIDIDIEIKNETPDTITGFVTLILEDGTKKVISDILDGEEIKQTLDIVSNPEIASKTMTYLFADILDNDEKIQQIEILKNKIKLNMRKLNKMNGVGIDVLLIEYNKMLKFKINDIAGMIYKHEQESKIKKYENDSISSFRW